MPVSTISWHNDTLSIIDQTMLPLEHRRIDLNTIEEVWEAIRMLRVRGAPAIGIAAAFGLYIGIKDFGGADFDAFREELEKKAQYLASARPTAINLFWALDRLKKIADDNAEMPIRDLKKRLLDEAQEMIEEDNRVCATIGDYGEELLQDGTTILTHCNAGGLATASYGTALAPVLRAKEKGKHISVFADETRPLLQGARLTTWECKENDIPVTLICDSMSGSVMTQGKVQAVIVGTDRVAANGDVCNKIGTFNLAVMAQYHKIPFYVAAPVSSIDMSLPSGKDIPIEERDPSEVTNGFGKRTAPEGIDVYNPAFDVTPHALVTALITEHGIIRPPFEENLKKLFDRIESTAKEQPIKVKTGE